mgnify:CR=1 FL=1
MKLNWTTLKDLLWTYFRPPLVLFGPFWDLFFLYGPLFFFLDLISTCIRPIKRFFNFKSRVGIFPLLLKSLCFQVTSSFISRSKSFKYGHCGVYTIELCSNYGLLLCTLLFSSLGLSSLRTKRRIE